MADPQLPLEPTIRIDPSTLVEHMPGTDAICLSDRGHDCGWPFCPCFPSHAGDEARRAAHQRYTEDHINDEEDT